MSDQLAVLFFTMAGLNTIDGSSIWMHSVAETLHVDPRLRITIPLRAPELRDVITRGLRRLPRVELLDPRKLGRPDPAGMNLRDAVDVLERVDRGRHHDIVLLRAYEVCAEVVRRGLFTGRLWSAYILEPERDTTDPEYLAGMTRIAEASRHVVVQSEEMRALLEALVPAAIGKTIILAPGIPDVTAERPDPGRIVPRMIYAGKFHRFYPVDQMIAALSELRLSHPELEFHVAGDKFHRPRGDSGYAAALARSLIDTPGVIWHGGIGRDEVEALLSAGGIALSLWDFQHGPGMNNLVISTKLLDFCSMGLPVILNRTAAQEGVLGPDYPLFVNRPDEALPLLRRLLEDQDLYRRASERSYAGGRLFTYPAVYAHIAPYVERVLDEVRVGPTGRSRVTIDADGEGQVAELLAPLARLDVHRHSDAAGAFGTLVVERLLGAEGFVRDHGNGRSAAATSDRRVLRLTGSADDARTLGEVGGFDRIVVGDGTLAAALVEEGIERERVVVVPSPIDDAQLGRPKLPGAMFNIAVAGMPTADQRVALARFASHLQQEDERFRVIVRAGSVEPPEPNGTAPTALVGPGPVARDTLAWEPDDGDEPSWHRTTGFVVAVDPDAAQARDIWKGMASGSAPILIDRAGAAGWILGESAAVSPDAAATLVVAMVRDGRRDAAGRRAADMIDGIVGLGAVRAAWVRELT